MTTTFSEEAKQDILGIGAWTYHQWGEEQVDVYKGHLSKLFLAIAANPMSPLSRALQDDTPEARQRHIRSIFRRGRHFVYYRVLPGSVHILRVLHDRMMVEGHVTWE